MAHKINIKECLTDNNLDLSMSNLEEVPVKKIAAITKANSLDLSSNQLTTLSISFATSLTHISVLDLSQNQITELPENFGLLVNLKHLDLFKNKLRTLPISIANLKALKWLDLNANPLVQKMAEVVGPCSNVVECQEAAKRVVAFMTEINFRVEAEKQRRKVLQLKQNNTSEADMELLEITDHKTKKKKKKNKKNNIKNLDLITDDLQREGLTIQNSSVGNKIFKEPPSSSPSLVWCILKGLFKVLLYTLLFGLLTLFVISLIDEPTYHGIKVKVNHISKTASSHLPQDFIKYYNQIVSNASKYVKFTVDNIFKLSYSTIVRISDFYNYLSTDERIQIHVDTMKDWIHVIYIKLSDAAAVIYSETKAFIKKVAD